MFYTVYDLAMHRDACGNTGDYFLFTCKYSIVYVRVIFAHCDDLYTFYLLEWISIKRRDTTRLIYEILSLAGKGTSKYRIISLVGLSFSQAQTYLSFLVDNAHLELDTNSNGVKQYKLTSKGEKLRYFLAEVQDQLDALFTSPPDSLMSSVDSLLASGRERDIDKPSPWR